MKTLRQTFAVIVLTVAIAVSALAGQISSPGYAPPPPPRGDQQMPATTSSPNLTTTIILAIINLIP